MRLSAWRSLCLLAITLIVSACATLSPDYEEPTVTLNSFRALPSEGMAPKFEIGLNILNPNRDALNIEGIVYTVSIENKEIIKGVGKDFPVIEGYSQGDVTLTATAQLISAFRVLAGLMREQGEELQWTLEAKIDPGGIYPSIRVRESGSFRMDGSNLASPGDRTSASDAG